MNLEGKKNLPREDAKSLAQGIEETNQSLVPDTRGATLPQTMVGPLDRIVILHSIEGTMMIIRMNYVHRIMKDGGNELPHTLLELKNFGVQAEGTVGEDGAKTTRTFGAWNVKHPKYGRSVVCVISRRVEEVGISENGSAKFHQIAGLTKMYGQIVVCSGRTTSKARLPWTDTLGSKAPNHLRTEGEGAVGNKYV